MDRQKSLLNYNENNMTLINVFDHLQVLSLIKLSPTVPNSAAKVLVWKLVTTAKINKVGTNITIPIVLHELSPNPCCF